MIHILYVLNPEFSIDLGMLVWCYFFIISFHGQVGDWVEVVLARTTSMAL
jgi:hypothetical protein